jgi:probable rRNA maturation factor
MLRFKISLRVDAALAGQVDPRRVRAAARAALAQQSAEAPGALTIVVTGDAALRRLNREYLGRDRPTDVLAFPASQAPRAPLKLQVKRAGQADPKSGRRYFGDIVLSFPRARAQAKAAGHPVSAEVQLLVVHGVLHLLGHDHAAPRDKARMWAAQANILRRLKAPITDPDPQA